MESLPKLGVGLGYRSPFMGDIFLHHQQIDFLEIVADHFMSDIPQKNHELQMLREEFTLIPHGLNLSLGSAEGVNLEYVEKLAVLIEKVSPPWWSEHICFTTAGGIDIGHLSPLPFNQESVDVLCRNVETVRKYIKTPLLLENITYLFRVPGSTMTEAEFISKVIRTTGCGLLLDLTNVYTNATNYNYDIEEYLAHLPMEKVVQLHFVGGHWDEDVLIDSHSHTTPPEVWSIMHKVFERAAVKGAILERDENLPHFDEILQELNKAREISKKWP
ncbi:DUF692 domain-containing protein [Candidatus Uabimicrobium amorphum]|uniref:UPF0276 protein n=1 Tax=Uabimicrobium amorphum TaxID=2596890 RepID=A0A5S9IKM5_UABAM|nr:DUF692 domain-containing protein [Candidatus Uabimicrobium amorphum]BBM82800.1 UPF0276 protein [Candidatus Uabimicrobium amorphum]